LATLPKTHPRDLRTWDARQITRVAGQSALAEALKWFARERAWINEQHLQICRIAAPTFFEQNRAEWLRTQLDKLGWTASLDRAGNVIATFGATRVPRPLVVSAHLDTVFAPARPESVSFAPDGRLTGPGAADNGCGLAALLALGKIFATIPALRELASSVLLVANVGEEGEGNLSGMRFLCQYGLPASGLRALVVLDGPAVDHVTAHALASHRFEISFAGPGGHSWNDSGIPNPVHAVSDLVSSFLRELDERLPEDRRALASYNFSVIEGGSSINAIPANARTKLDLRSEDPALVEELAAWLTPVVERCLERANRSAAGPRLVAKVRSLGNRPGGRLSSDAPLLRAIQAIDRHLQIRSRLHCASTDANVPLSMGLPAISIGAGGQGGGAHTESEWYQPEGRELGLRRILLLLAVLASEDAADEDPSL
jgi:tripeptide aminopeptidase